MLFNTVTIHYKCGHGQCIMTKIITLAHRVRVNKKLKDLVKPFTAPNNRTFSDISLTVFLANVCLQRLAPHGENLNHQTIHLMPVLHPCAYAWTRNCFVFVHTLANSCILHTIGKLTVYPLTPFS